MLYEENYEDADTRVVNLVAWACELADYGYDEDEILDIMFPVQESDGHE
jgi:hypothetical protein